jgi:hypothetical protein
MIWIFGSYKLWMGIIEERLVLTVQISSCHILQLLLSTIKVGKCTLNLFSYFKKFNII